MGAKKWSTILKENYDKTGRLWPNCTLEDEIKYYTEAGFCNPVELIIWSDARHYTLRYFYYTYFYNVPNVNTLTSLVKEMFFSRLSSMDLYKLLSDEVILTFADRIVVNDGLLEKIKTTYGPNHEINKDIFIRMLWLHSNIKRMMDKYFSFDKIRDLICFLILKQENEIVNYRASLKLITVLKKAV